MKIIRILVVWGAVYMFQRTLVGVVLTIAGLDGEIGIAAGLPILAVMIAIATYVVVRVERWIRHRSFVTD